MISVSLNGFDKNDRITATVYPSTENHPPFMAFVIGDVTVILASAAQARKLAGELHRSADTLDAMPDTFSTVAVAEEVTL